MFHRKYQQHKIWFKTEEKLDLKHKNIKYLRTLLKKFFWYWIKIFKNFHLSLYWCSFFYKSLTRFVIKLLWVSDLRKCSSQLKSKSEVFGLAFSLRHLVHSISAWRSIFLGRTKCSWSYLEQQKLNWVVFLVKKVLLTSIFVLK